MATDFHAPTRFAGQTAISNSAQHAGSLLFAARSRMEFLATIADHRLMYWPKHSKDVECAERSVAAKATQLQQRTCDRLEDALSWLSEFAPLFKSRFQDIPRIMASPESYGKFYVAILNVIHPVRGISSRLQPP